MTFLKILVGIVLAISVLGAGVLILLVLAMGRFADDLYPYETYTMAEWKAIEKEQEETNNA